MNDEKFATELLHEVKASATRWFYAFIIVLVLWFATIAVFLWYASLPIDEYEVTQDSEGDNNTMIGVGDYGTTDSKGEETP